MVNCHILYTSCTPRILRCGAALALALLVAACTPEPAPDLEIGFRNPTVTLAGSTRYDSARFAGGWVTVACLGTCAETVRYIPATDGVMLREAVGEQVAYRSVGPGILREVGGAGVLVVMWVDEGFRTAAVGDVDGDWAAVIDRTGRGGADRVAAAIEVLDFNGWRVEALAR